MSLIAACCMLQFDICTAAAVDSVNSSLQSYLNQNSYSSYASSSSCDEVNEQGWFPCEEDEPQGNQCLKGCIEHCKDDASGEAAAQALTNANSICDSWCDHKYPRVNPDQVHGEANNVDICTQSNGSSVGVGDKCHTTVDLICEPNSVSCTCSFSVIVEDPEINLIDPLVAGFGG